jgi:MFS family permease
LVARPALTGRRRDRSAAAWTTAAILALAHLSAFTDRYLVSLVAPALKADLALSDFQLGLLQGTAFVLIYAVGALASGPLIERRRKLPIVAACVALWSLATVACGLARSFAELFAARLLLGLGQAALSPAALSLIAAVMPPGQLGRGVSLYTTGSTLGRSAALLGGGALLRLLTTASATVFGLDAPWRALFLAIALPNVALVAAVLLLPEAAPPPPRLRDRVWRGWLAREWRSYALHIAAAGAATLIIQSVTAWTTVALTRGHGLSIPEAGAAFGTIVLVAGPAGHLSGGYLLDRLRPRFGRRTPHVVLAISFLSSWPAAALFCLADATGTALAGLAALTVTLGLATPAGFGGLQMMTPRRIRARANALFLCCNTLIGFGLGPPLVGLLNDRLLGEAAVRLSLLATVTAACLVGLAACAARLAGRRRHRSEYEKLRSSAL